MARHAEVGEESVDMVDTIVAHPVLQKPEVAEHEGEIAGITEVRSGTVSSRHRYTLCRVGILVEAVQMAGATKTG